MINSINVNSYKNTGYLFYLLLILFFSHFFPFERLSVSPDDYTFLTVENYGLYNFVINSHRPLQYLWYEFQNYLIGVNGFYGLCLLFVINFLFIISSYFLYLVIFNNKKLSYFLSIINILLIFKVEIYSGPVFNHIILASTIYILSILFFNKYIESNNRLYYFLSIVFYTVAIFWYESGFFIPVLFVYIKYVDGKDGLSLKSILKLFTPIIFIILFYSYYRLSGAFGFYEYSGGRQINITLIFQSFTDLFNNIFGRTFIRISIYGLYNFFKIYYLNLIILIIFNILFIIYLFNFINNYSFERIKNKKIFQFIILFIICLVPSILSGNVGPRSMIISLVGVPPIIYFFSTLIPFKKYFFIILLNFFLIISQGNSWTQIISSRINYEVFNYFNLYKDKLIDTDIIIFDKSSFAKNIKYTFVENDYNILNTYFGAQCFENWGIISMFDLSTNYAINSDDIYIVSEKPIFDIDDKIILVEYQNSGYKKINKIKHIVSSDNYHIVNYDSVYSKSYFQGLNR